MDQERVSGTAGCNRLIGGFQLAGEELSFSRLVSTKMARCSGLTENLHRHRGWAPEVA